MSIQCFQGRFSQEKNPVNSGCSSHLNGPLFVLHHRKSTDQVTLEKYHEKPMGQGSILSDDVLTFWENTSPLAMIHNQHQLITMSYEANV